MVETQKVFNFWERNPKSAPGSIEITVHNKGDLPVDLNPIHVTQITTALSVMPQGFENRLKTLYVVYGDPQMRRGLSGVGVVFMKGEEDLIQTYGKNFMESLSRIKVLADSHDRKDAYRSGQIRMAES